MRVAGVGRALPGNYYEQDALLDAFRRLWGHHFRNPARLDQIHRNVMVGGRHLALPIDQYEKLGSFTDANDAYVRCAVDLGELAIEDALARADLAPTDVDAIFSVSVTGIAVPSVDARLVNRMGLRRDVKRIPIFGLGCVAGAAGIARAADYVRGHPDEVALLLSVELCSLTLQRADFSIQNVVASGLFGDGAAAVVVVGEGHPAPGPRILGSRSAFFPDTERVMGWDVTSEGFRIVLSGDVPEVVRRHVRPEVDAFLAEHGLRIGDIDRFVCHPGGPKVLLALAEALEQSPEAFAPTWRSLQELGNLSSASVLMVLRDVLDAQPVPGEHGLMISMGPGFCAELVLLRW